MNDLENIETRNQGYELIKAERKIKLLTKEIDHMRDELLESEDAQGELFKRIQNLEDIIKETEKPEPSPKPEEKPKPKEDW